MNASQDAAGAAVPDLNIDARGALCPQPVLMLARAARAHPGGLISVLADDAAAVTDIPAWCDLRGAELVGLHDESGHTRFLIRAPASAEGGGKG